MTNLSNLNLTKGTIPPLLKYKIVFLGDQGVGKSSIINRFIYDIFDGNEQRPTIGIDFISQNIFLEEKTIRLQLWDTAGQERFRNLIPNYIRDSSVAVIVYDVTKKESFKGLQKWIDDVKYQRGEGAIIAILANKIDIENREILYEEGRKLAEENNFLFQEVSAKTGVNVQEFFKQIAALLPDVPDQTSQTSHSRAEHQSQPIQQVINSNPPNSKIMLNNKVEKQNLQQTTQITKRSACC